MDFGNIIEGVGPASLLDTPGCKACMNRDAKALLIMIVENTIKEVERKDKEYRQQATSFAREKYSPEPEPGTPTWVALTMYNSLLSELKTLEVCGIPKVPTRKR